MASAVSYNHTLTTLIKHSKNTLKYHQAGMFEGRGLGEMLAFLPGVGDADAVVDVRQRHLQEVVGDDCRGVREAEQRVVRENRLCEGRGRIYSVWQVLLVGRATVSNVGTLSTDNSAATPDTQDFGQQHRYNPDRLLLI